MNFTDWLKELAALMHGEFDEEGNLCVDPGDGLGANSYAFKELRQIYQTNCSPAEAVSILQGAMS